MVCYAKSIVGHDLCAAVEAQHVLEPVDPIVQVSDGILELLGRLPQALAARPHLLRPLLVLCSPIHHYSFVLLHLLLALASVLRQLLLGDHLPHLLHHPLRFL